MRPIIAMLAEICDDLGARVPNTYVKAVEMAGGIPLLVPLVVNDETADDIVSLCDGFLFTGGEDIDPARYGETKKETCGEISFYRDELEFRFMERALASGKPIVAICRGIQLLNVALGGTLHQDIPTELESNIRHVQSEPKLAPSHKVKIIPDTPLYELLKVEYVQGNSFHHQAIKKLGRGLSVMALADDGVIEGVYTDGEQYIRGYQWHPERLVESDTDNLKIFVDLMDACKNKKQGAEK